MITSLKHCALGLALYLAAHPYSVADDAIPVLVKPLSELVIYPESTAAAQVVSLNETAVAAQLDGVVASVAVRVGDRVKAGDVLVKLNCTDAELELARLKAEREALVAKLELANWHLQQTQVLTQQRTLPQEKLQEKRAEAAAIKADLNAQALRIKTAQRQVGHCAVIAPFAGVVTQREVSEGQSVSRGMALISLLDLNLIEVSAQVASGDLVRLGSASGLAFESSGQRFPLKLRAILPAIQSQTGTQEVRLDFSNRPARPGAAGRLIWQNPGRFIASEHLLKRDKGFGLFTAKGGQAHFIVIPDAQAGKPAPVELPPDTAVIVSGQYSLTEGTAVSVKALNRNEPAASLPLSVSKPEHP